MTATTLLPQPVQIPQHQDQDQDTDQDQDVLVLTNHQDHYQNHSNEAEVWVCECCALVISLPRAINGDRTSCRDYFNHTHPNCDPAIIHLTDEMFTIGYFHTNCDGCGVIQRSEATMYGAIRAIN